MGVFSRLSDIVNANINSLLDRAEDPEKMVRLMIQEMEDTLVEVRSAAVKAIADKKEVERKLRKLHDGQVEWDTKAEFAVSKGRDDLAKGALMARRRLADQSLVLERELEVIEETLGKYDEDLNKLQNKLNEAKAKQRTVEIRMQTAEKRVKMKEKLHSGQIDEALLRYEQMERRIDELEANADSWELGRGQSLEEQFEDLEAELGIEDDLKELKARVKKDTKKDK
ncbi:phage shock protein PspA [Thalassospira sp.]|uniref:phage shock protein PspA n=1 Tax=Thalassospira sp. TaxID=1912094 RepID=UPI000C6693DA|nr:phage shock protein PspA [Thalassospira sp.]MBC06788.1 phage shock protein PspA [Thalassospira sp.]|tara:strand:+ start:1785 stop:2462 length:678 start_codon:yes stop_codon:yes gene_type:complete